MHATEPEAAPTAFDQGRPNRDAPARPVTRIEAQRGWRRLELSELWRYRELLYFLVWRDIKVRYKQTVLGVMWAVIQPLLAMLIFTLVFGRLVKVPSDGIPYPLFAYAALVPWTFFANSVAQASESLVGSSNLVTKVYFPRLTLPLGTVFAGLVDFALAFIILLLLMLHFGVNVQARVVLLPLFLLLAVLSCIAVGVWLSALNVRFRDVRYTVPFVLQFWLFATPVVYPSSLLPEPWRLLYGLNPMAGVIEGFRWSLLGAETGPGRMIAVSCAVALVGLLSGLFYFRRVEKSFADVI